MGALGALQTKAAASGVEVLSHEADRRVDIVVDGRPFTSYIWPESLTRPVLFPLRADKGVFITRGFPLEPRPGERADHPHHVGFWLSYGDVNGVDFWNNATLLPPEQQAKMGRSRHVKVLAAESGAREGRLRVAIEWVMPDGSVILDEETTFVFRGGSGQRLIDRTTRLSARDTPVRFADNKEGFLGLRVARFLEHPSTEPTIFTDAAGRATTVAVLDNTGVTGHYRSSEGKEGDAVWGTRGRWVALSGRLDDQEATVALFDHPANPGAPTYWHARGYGLFAANPLGQAVFSNGRETLNFALAPRAAALFRWRVVILSRPYVPAEMEALSKELAAER